MKAPRHYIITICGDADQVLGRQDRRGLHYLLDRLLTGEEVADSEWVHHGLKVAAEPDPEPGQEDVRF